MVTERARARRSLRRRIANRTAYTGARDCLIALGLSAFTQRISGKPNAWAWRGPGTMAVSRRILAAFRGAHPGRAIDVEGGLLTKTRRKAPLAILSRQAALGRHRAAGSAAGDDGAVVLRTEGPRAARSEQQRSRALHSR